HARVNEVVAVLGPLYLLVEQREVAVDAGIDGFGGGLHADDAEGLADDGAVGHPGQAERVTRVEPAVELLEGARDGSAAGTTGGHEGPIDVEEEHGRTHGHHVTEGPARSEPGREERNCAPGGRSGHEEGETLLERPSLATGLDPARGAFAETGWFEAPRL